jgi:hypothetical protein
VSAEEAWMVRLNAVESLARLPLYQLSTAGLELFHTYMLYWLAAERPEESVADWNALGPPTARAGGHSPCIRRDWRHIDLMVSPGGERLSDLPCHAWDKEQVQKPPQSKSSQRERLQ